MKKFILPAFLLTVSALLFSCKTKQPAAETTHVSELQTEDLNKVETGDSLVAYLERTACYGQCPMYKFSIYNSGYAVYEGKRFVEKLGKYEARISKTALDEIRSKARAINYFDFKDQYPKTASDFPATKTAIVLDGKRKDIMDGSNAPSALKEFEKYLDSIKDSADWKQVH